jgi:hypothetical protein
MSEPTTMRRPASPRSAVAAPVREWLAVDIGDGETLSAADLLRLLDRMRQELSRRLVGSAGAFVGYDSLTVSQRTVAGPGRVIVEARLMGLSEQLHDVEYLAVSVPTRAERPAATDPLLMRGTGRTLNVEC